ncbi:hypothetical protein [Mucilaginibacter sp.]|uniref:hypothetical protein n=1 Tax=Mucilaginibacter sp. TaxID=1882438 RepID=UPI00260DB06B|nr:hypothetical protein [Mucilaginibacter sp.]
MKKILPMLMLLIISLTGCKKDAAITQFDNSYKKWQQFKSQSNNSYSYIAYRFYTFLGDRTETKITVKNGKVIEREYTMWTNQPNSAVTVVAETWVENEALLNSHQQLRAAEILTLDQVYAKAKTVWLKVNKKDNEIFFVDKNDGLISSAGSIPKGCQDDCFNGISIKEIKLLK